MSFHKNLHCLQLLHFLQTYKKKFLIWQAYLWPCGTINGATNSRRLCEISHGAIGSSLLRLVRCLWVFPCWSNCSHCATWAGRLMRCEEVIGIFESIRFLSSYSPPVYTNKHLKHLVGLECLFVTREEGNLKKNHVERILSMFIYFYLCE